LDFDALVIADVFAKTTRRTPDRVLTEWRSRQSDDALGRIQRIDEMLEGWRARVAKLPSRLPEKTIGLFAENPFWSVNILAARLDVAFTTAQRAVDRLEDAGIVAIHGEARRNRVYCARSILEILEAPPRLAQGAATRRRGRRSRAGRIE
jgi:hypothetical protein